MRMNIKKTSLMKMMTSTPIMEMMVIKIMMKMDAPLNQEKFESLQNYCCFRLIQLEKNGYHFVKQLFCDRLT